MVKQKYFRLVAFQFILLTALSINSYAESKILLTGGYLAGQDLSKSKWTIYVKPEEHIYGNVICETHNQYPSDDVVRFGYTWTWGKRESAIETVGDWIAKGIKSWDIPIDLKSPTEPDTYYIIFGLNREFNMEQVLSSTSWVCKKSEWYDGNDFHDMDERNLYFAHLSGYVSNWPYLGESGYDTKNVPVMPIKVVVKRKFLYGNKGVLSNIFSSPWFIAFVSTIIGGIIVYFITRNFIC